MDPSPVESNDSHSTDVTDIDADDVQSPRPGDELKSPDIEIMSPASGRSADEVSVCCLAVHIMVALGRVLTSDDAAAAAD